LVVAGTHSGVGKTTIALGLMAAFRRRGLTVQPFKLGPDFIDPGHHAQVAGQVSRNLDGWILSREMNRTIYHCHASRADVAVVEGVMGLFDGCDGLSEAGSTAQMAKWLELPVVLVVDAHSMARSVGAVVHGFATFDPEVRLTGVVFNRIAGKGHLRYLRQALTYLEGIPCLGGLPADEGLTIPERHLGLVTGDEYPLGEECIERLATLVEENLDVDRLLDHLPRTPLSAVRERAGYLLSVRLGLARDRAFCFYYPENIEWLAYFGAELVPFSPLEDQDLPQDIHGIYLGGGYPEVFASQLAANIAMRKAIRVRAQQGMPIYAECGGLMYLCREIRDMEGCTYPMVGVFPMVVRMSSRLRALGYREVTLLEGGLLGPAGTTGRGHEFHYSEIVSESESIKRLYRVSGPGTAEVRLEGYGIRNVLASYVHLHFGSNPQMAWHLVQKCREYKERR
jgi:cobyrinic acid a,c-diamide synthase